MSVLAAPLGLYRPLTGRDQARHQHFGLSNFILIHCTKGVQEAGSTCRKYSDVSCFPCLYNIWTEIKPPS
jgi:hypothetical protein